ncbi:hypothetical protein JCM10212_003280 [Sporobolomyces blumeae]
MHPNTTTGKRTTTPLIARPSSLPQNPLHAAHRPPPSFPLHGGLPPPAMNPLAYSLGGALNVMGYNGMHYPPVHQAAMHAPLPYYDPPAPVRTAAAPPLPPAHSHAFLPARPAHLPYLPSSAPSTSHRSTSTNPVPARPPRSSGPAAAPSELHCTALAGCPFSTRSRKLLREHLEDRHLVFEPGREPKPWSGSLKPLDGAVIEGTGITLDSEEAVRKWREDRKRRWPSKKVVEEKERQREERVKAGLEAPPRERNAGRGRGRGGRGDFGGDHGGRGGGARGLGRGAMGGHGGEGRDNGSKRAMGDEARMEGPEQKKAKVDATEGPAKVDADESGDSTSSDSSELSSSDSESDDASVAGPEDVDDDAAEDGDEGDSDGEPVEEMSTKRNAELPNGGNDSVTASPTKQFQVVCRQWRKGTCALGDAQCPYLHTIPPGQADPPPPRRQRPHPRAPPHNPFARPSLTTASNPFSSTPSAFDAFSVLEEHDLRHELNDLLQVIEWTGANGWLKGVELRIGQKDEESGIEVVGQSEDARLGSGGNEANGVHDEGEGEDETVGADAASDKVDLTPSTSLVNVASYTLPNKPSISVIESASSLPPPSTGPLPTTLVPPSLASATKPSTTTIPKASGPARPSGLSLVADYSSDDSQDSDSELEENLVAESLRPKQSTVASTLS